MSHVRTQHDTSEVSHLSLKSATMTTVLVSNYAEWESKMLLPVKPPRWLPRRGKLVIVVIVHYSCVGVYNEPN